MDRQRLERYAELTVRFAANVAEGQLVVIQAHLEHAPLVRAVTGAAYRAGARWVGADYRDEHLRRALVGRARPLAYAERWREIAVGGRVSWTIVPAPTVGWAEQVFGRPDEERLWQALEMAMRMTEPDP